uniref:Uncharacterized protein n=1 Tax=Anguilla anguilla TaxID=7936 RepID=A0A0E9XHH1_ANGAN
MISLGRACRASCSVFNQLHWTHMSPVRVELEILLCARAAVPCFNGARVIMSPVFCFFLQKLSFNFTNDSAKQ